MAGLLDKLIRSARSTRGNGNGGAKKSPTKKKSRAAKKGGASGTIEVALSKRNAQPVLQTLEDVGYQLIGQAALIESGAVEGSASEARGLRTQAKHIETMRYALAGAL